MKKMILTIAVIFMATFSVQAQSYDIDATINGKHISSKRIHIGKNIDGSPDVYLDGKLMHYPQYSYQEIESVSVGGEDDGEVGISRIIIDFKIKNPKTNINKSTDIKVKK